MSDTQADAPETQGTVPDRLANIEAQINRYLPVLEELANVADAANKQNHSLSSILGAVGSQLLGIFLHPK